MLIKINGKTENIEKANNLSDLIRLKRLDANKVIVEYNGKIITKDNLEKISLKEKDTIELVSFVGGG